MHLLDWKVKTDSFVQDQGKGRQDTNFYHPIPGAFLKASQGPPALLPVHSGLISHNWVSALTATLQHPSGSQV